MTAPHSSQPGTGKSPSSTAGQTGPFTLRPLPYSESALEPVISARTLQFHHGKHHKAYVEKLNELIRGTELEDRSLESIIKATADDKDRVKIYNNAAQVWNHDFY